MSRSVSPGHEQTQVCKRTSLTNEMRYQWVRGQPTALRGRIKHLERVIVVGKWAFIIEELIEHFTLVAEDLEFLANKTGPTRLGCALLLKCFQYEGRFPSASFSYPRVPPRQSVVILAQLEPSREPLCARAATGIL